MYEDEAKNMGFSGAVGGAMVRSSYWGGI